MKIMVELPDAQATRLQQEASRLGVQPPTWRALR
jgi:hypothetical protein